MKILVFGALCDITSASYLEYDEIADTTTLLQKLHADFPLLQDKKFAIAVDKQIINEPTQLHHHAEIALLPPFSGG